MFLHKPGCRYATAAAPKVDLPANGAGQVGMRLGPDPLGRRCADPPTRDGGDRLGGQLPQLIGTAATADHQSGNAALLRRQLQAPALREIERRQLRHDGREAGAAQRFFHRPERIAVALDTQMQEPIGVAPTCRQGAGIKIALPPDPQEAAAAMCPLPPPDEMGDRCGGKARFLKIRPTPGKLMQRAGCQDTPRQMPVERGQSPAQAFLAVRLRAELGRLVQPRDLPPQCHEPRRLRGRRAGGRSCGKRAVIIHIPFLFSSPAESRNENV